MFVLVEKQITNKPESISYVERGLAGRQSLFSRREARSESGCSEGIRFMMAVARGPVLSCAVDPLAGQGSALKANDPPSQLCCV